MPEYPERVDDHYGRIYFEALDLVTTTINDRFNQADYAVYVKQARRQGGKTGGGGGGGGGG